MKGLLILLLINIIIIIKILEFEKVIKIAFELHILKIIYKLSFFR